MFLADIHCHALYGVDDGARDGPEMQTMLDALYADGVRAVCLTPHHNPRLFPARPDAVERHFGQAVDYIRSAHPDMRLCLGSEFCFGPNIIQTLQNDCRLTLNQSRYVLVEFLPSEDPYTIRHGVADLLAAGFVPVIAHVERYGRLTNADIRDIRENGAYIQVNADTVTGANGFGAKRRVNRLIRLGLVDVVADDCHRTDHKPAGLSAAYQAVCRTCGEDQGKRLFHTNPLRILFGTAEE